LTLWSDVIGLLPYGNVLHASTTLKGANPLAKEVDVQGMKDNDAKQTVFPVRPVRVMGG